MSDRVASDCALRVSVGQVTSAGAKDVNEDCIGLRVPEGLALRMKGVAAVIADGVSSAEAGREASESCVQSFLADYYSTPDVWTVQKSAKAILTALNRWLYSKSHGMEAHRGYVSTLSALILKSRTAHIIHIGDSRIYRLRDGHLEQLTRDHATRITEKETYLARAMGMDVRLEVDYRSVDLRTGDVFLLTTDGIHDFLSPEHLAAEIARALAADEAFEATGHRLVQDALAAGSRDNLSCQILCVDALPADDVDSLHKRLTQLSFPPLLNPGMKIDAWRVEKELHASPRSQLYLVSALDTGERGVMKTPSVNFEDDPDYIERFVMEPWIAKRLASSSVAGILEREVAQSFLYYVMEYVEGPTLRQWMEANPKPQIAEVLDIVDQIAAAVRAFERRETFHQDLKPDNIMFTAEGEVKLVDLGSCRVAGLDEIHSPLDRERPLGTARYSAPEARRGQSAGIRSEIFSLATIVYEMLTGQLPYGEKIEQAMSERSFERLEYTPSYHYNPMVPVWLDGALALALEVMPRRRYAALSELLYDLRHPNKRFQNLVPRPLIERDPLRFFKGVAAILLGVELLTLWLWLH